MVYLDLKSFSTKDENIEREFIDIQVYKYRVYVLNQIDKYVQTHYLCHEELQFKSRCRI